MRPLPLLAPAVLRLSVVSNGRVCAPLDAAGIVRNESREGERAGRSAELAAEHAWGVEADARWRSLEGDNLVIRQPDPLPAKGELSRAGALPSVQLLVGEGFLFSVLSATGSGGLDPVASNGAATTRVRSLPIERNVALASDDLVTVP